MVMVMVMVKGMGRARATSVYHREGKGRAPASAVHTVQSKPIDEVGSGAEPSLDGTKWDSIGVEPSGTLQGSSTSSAGGFP